jgi:hypothetical protein
MDNFYNFFKPFVRKNLKNGRHGANFVVSRAKQTTPDSAEFYIKAAAMNGVSISGQERAP